MYDEWITRRAHDPMKWGGTLMFAIGSILISAVPQLGSVWWPFAIFLIGHILWASAGLAMNDRAILVMNLMYVPIDIYAIWVRLLTA